MIYSSWNKECDYGTFSALSYTPKKPKNQNLKKNCWRYHHFTQVHQKPQSCKAQFLVYRVRQAKLFVILGDFLPFLYPINPKKSKFKKNENSIWRCHHFAHMYQKPQSYDVCFLRYGVRHTIFCDFGPFLPFYPTTFFKIGIHSMQGWTDTTRHGVTRKWSIKRLKHTANLFRKNLQLKDAC